MTDARVTQQAVQLIANLDPALRVTQQAVEVVARRDPEASVTQQAVEVVARQNPAARVGQQVLMIVNKTRPPRGPSRQVPIAISMTSEKGIPGDAYWSRVEFLVRSDIGYFDLSRRHRSFGMDRRTGPFLTTAQAKFGNASFHQRTVASSAVRHFGLACAPDRERYGIGRRKFTIEGWIRVPAASYAVVLSCYDPDTADRGWALHLQGGVPTFWASDPANTGATVNLAAAGQLALNVWHHLAVDRDGEGVIRLYVNGVMAASVSYPGMIRKAGARLKMGSSHTNNAAECWLDDVRFTNGVCRYGSDTGFTVPAAHYPYEPWDVPALSIAEDRYYDLVSVMLDTAAGLVDLGPRNVPLYGDPAPGTTTSQQPSWYDGPVLPFWSLSGAKIVVPDVDDQNNLGDGSPFTIESMFLYYASQGIVSYDILKVEGQWMLWASASNMRIYFWNGTGWTSVGNAGDNSYASAVHFAFTYDGKGTSRMYMNGYLVDKTVGVYPPNVPEAVLQLGWQSSPGRINEFRITKGVARWTDDYCIPAHDYFHPPAQDGPPYVPEPPAEQEYHYPFPLAVVNPDATSDPGSEWLQLSGNVPSRWDKFVQTGGYGDPPDGFHFFHLTTMARVHTIQSIPVPEEIHEDIDATLVDAVFDLDFGLDAANTAASGCFLIRARNALGQVMVQRYSRNFSAENWSRRQICLPLPAGTRSVDIGFLANNAGSLPAINFTNLQATLARRGEPARYAAFPTYPPVAAEWGTNLGGAITTLALDYGTTGLAQTANMSDTWFEADLPAASADDIDAGACAFEMHWFGSLHSGDLNDGGRLWVEFYDADDGLLGQRRYDEAAYYLQKPGGEGGQLVVRCPPGARKARMGYRGVRSALETGLVSFYPLGIHGLVTKPDVLPADPPAPPEILTDPEWHRVRYLLSSRNGAVENLAAYGSTTHAVAGTVQHTSADSRFDDGHNIEINPSGAAANTHYIDVVLPGTAFKTEMTIEAWLLKKGNPRNYMGIINGLGQWNDSASYSFQLHGPVIRPDAPIPYDEWFHVAFCRGADGVCEMFVNGRKQISVNLSYLTALGAAFTIGRSSSAGDNASWYGYVDEMRITDGVARYGTDFIPQSNRYPLAGDVEQMLPIVYTGMASSGSNTASYSHTNQPLGAPFADRRIIVCVVNNRNTGLAGAPGTVTVAGISAAKIAESDSSWHGGLHNVSISWWVADVPTGTTGTIAVGYTGNRYRHAIAIWSCRGEPELIDHVQGSDGTPSAGTIMAGEGGRVLAVALNSINTGNHMTLADRFIHEDGELEITNDFLAWTGVEPIASVNVENDSTGMFNRFSAVSVVVSGSYTVIGG